MVTMPFRKCAILFLALLALPYADCDPDAEASNDNDVDYNNNNREGESLSVSGRLLCDGKPLRSAFIRLYDADNMKKDDLLSQARTNDTGYFDITGYDDEYGGIEPYITISKVLCGVSCESKWRTKIDFVKVKDDTHERRDIGTIDMANVCANVDADSTLKVPEFISKSKDPEDYDTQYKQLMDLRWSWSTRKAARQFGRTTGVSAQVMCAGNPLQYVKVKLFDAHSGELVNRTHTDANGHFVIVGHKNADLIKPFLILSNAKCSANCTGSTEFKLVFKDVTDISVLTLGTMDLANACQAPELAREFHHEDFDVSGRLTCRGAALSGVHVTLYDANAFFAYPNAEQRLLVPNTIEGDEGRVPVNRRLLDTDTTDTGHFSLRTTDFAVNENLFLNISGIRCGTKCDGNWHMKMVGLTAREAIMLERVVFDLGSMDLDNVCSTYENGENILYTEFLNWKLFESSANESTSIYV